MNKLRKALVVILSALFLLCVSLFAACTTGSGKTQAQKPDDAVTPGQSEQESEEKPGDPQEETCDIHVEVNDEALGAYRLSGERAVNGGFKVGTPVTVTVEPAAGYDATLKVNGEEVPLDGGSYTFTAQADTTLSVDYNYKYRISTTVLAGEGTITPAAPADGEKYAEGEDVKVEVAPAAGYVVEYVKINGVVTEPDEDGKYTVKMTGRMYVVAEFIAVHTITVENNGNGTVTLNDAAYEAPIENVKDGTVYTLKVTPADGEEIKAVYVNGALTPLDAEGKATITVKADTLIKVVYVGRYTVSLPENENVVVNIAEGKAASYAEGTVLHITVSAVEGYRLTSVTVKVGETPVEALGGVYTVTMSANVTVEADVEALAEVEKHTVTILYNNGSFGSAELTGAEAVEGQYAYGSELTLTVTPNEGNELDKVEVNGKKVALEEGKYTFTVKEDTAIYIVFKALPRYIVTVDDRTGADATIAVSEPFDNNTDKAYYEGEELTITATEIAPHCLVFVAVDGGEPVDITADENGNYVWKHTVTADVKLTVTVLHSFSVEINNDPLKGTVERLLEGGSTEAVESWYQENEEVTLIITPLEGYRISKVTVVSGGESFVDEFDYITASHTVALLGENTVVTVEYVAIYEISVNVAGIDGVENASVVLTVVNTESGEQVKELGTLTESGEKTYTLDEGTSLKAKYTAPVTHRIGLDPQIPGVSFGGMGYVEPGADKEGTFDFSFTYNGGSVSVTYELYTHTVTVDGQLQEAPVTNSESYKLPAQPDPQYGLNGLNQNYEYTFTWVVNGVEYAAEATVENVRKDLVVTSKWSAQLPVEKSVTGTPEGGSVDWGNLQDASTLIEGTEFDVTIVVPQGYRAIVKFYTHTKNVITGSEGKVTTAMGVYQAKTEDLTAHFKDTVRAGLKLEIEITYEKIFTVTVTENENVDVVILSHGDYNNDYFTVGNVFEFTVTAHDGYKVTAVKANDTVLDLVDGKYSHVLTGETTITIETVKLASVALTVNGDPESNVTLTNGADSVETGASLPVGTKLTLNITVPEGYKVKYTVPGSEVQEAYETVTVDDIEVVDGGITISVEFVKVYTVTVEAENANVTLDPTNDKKAYELNAQVKVTVEAVGEYVIDSVTADVEGALVDNKDGTYTLTVTDNVTITVSVLPKLTVDFPVSNPDEPSTSNGAPEQGEWKAMDGADNVIEIGANTMTINGKPVTKIESNGKTDGTVVYTLTTDDGDYTMAWFGEAEGYILMLTDPSAAVSVSRRAVRTIAAGGVSYYVNPKYSAEYFDDFVEGDSEKLVNIDWTADESHLSVTNVDGKIHISLGEDAAKYVFAVEAGHYLFVIGAGAYDLTLAEDGSTLTVNGTTYSKPVENEVTRVYGAELRGVLLVLKIEVKGYTQEELNTAEIKLICGPDNTSYDKAALNSVGDYYELHFNGIINLGAGEHELSLKVGNQVFDNLTDSAQPSSVPNGEKTYELSVKETKLVLTVSEKTVEIEKKLEDFHGGSFNTNEETIEFFVHVYGYQDSELTAENVSLVYDTYTVDCALSGSLISNNIASNSHVIIHLQFKLETIGVHGATELKLKIGDDSYSINHSGLVGTGTKDGKVYNITHADGKLTLTVSEAQTEYTVRVMEESKIDGCSYELKNNGEDVGEKVPANATLTLTVTVPENYTATVKVDGATLENNGENSYTIKNITGDVTITITYAEKGEVNEPIDLPEEREHTANDIYADNFFSLHLANDGVKWIADNGVVKVLIDDADTPTVHEANKGFNIVGNNESINVMINGLTKTSHKSEYVLHWYNEAGQEVARTTVHFTGGSVDPDAPKELPSNGEDNAPNGWSYYNEGRTINATEKDGIVTVTFSGNQNGNWWGIQVYYKNKEYTSGAKITVSFTITSTVAGKIRFLDNGEDGTEVLEFTQDKLTLDFTSKAFVVNSKNTVVKLYMAIENEARIDAATITISDLHIEKVTDPEPQKSVTGTTAKLEQDENGVYLVVDGTSTGYDEAGLKALLEGYKYDFQRNSNLQLGNEDWTDYNRYQPKSVTITVNGANWTAKFDISNLEPYSYMFHFGPLVNQNDEMVPDNMFFADTSISGEETLDNKKYELNNMLGKSEGSDWRNNYGLLGIVVTDVTVPAYEATSVDLVNEDGTVYFVIKGTYANYEKTDLETALKAVHFNLQNNPNPDEHSVSNPEWGLYYNFTSVVTIDEEAHTWEIRYDVTVKDGNNVTLKNNGEESAVAWGAGAYTAHFGGEAVDLKQTAENGKTFTLGDRYVYTLHYYKDSKVGKEYWGCDGLSIVDKQSKELNATIDYNTLTFTKEGEDVYVSFTGTCQNITSESQLSLDFYDQNGERTVNPESVVVTLQDGTYTIKAKATNVPAGDYLMHLIIINGEAKRNINVISADKEGMQIGETYTIGNKTYKVSGKNYQGWAEGRICLTVEELNAPELTLQKAELLKDEDSKIYIVYTVGDLKNCEPAQLANVKFNGADGGLTWVISQTKTYKVVGDGTYKIYFEITNVPEGNREYYGNWWRTVLCFDGQSNLPKATGCVLGETKSVDGENGVYYTLHDEGGNPYFIVNQKLTITLNFGEGYEPESEQATVDYEANYTMPDKYVTLTRTGYVFGGWLRDGQKVDPNEQGKIVIEKVTDNLELTASWTKEQYDVTVSDNLGDVEGAGSVTVVPGNGQKVEFEGTVTITVSVNEGYRVTVKVNDHAELENYTDAAEKVITVTATGAVKIEVIFESTDTEVSNSVSPKFVGAGSDVSESDARGAISGLEGFRSYKANDSVTISFVVAKEYGATVTAGEAVTLGEPEIVAEGDDYKYTYTFTMPEEAVTVTITVAKRVDSSETKWGVQSGDSNISYQWQWFDRTRDDSADSKDKDENGGLLYGTITINMYDVTNMADAATHNFTLDTPYATVEITNRGFFARSNIEDVIKATWTEKGGEGELKLVFAFVLHPTENKRALGYTDSELWYATEGGKDQVSDTREIITYDFASEPVITWDKAYLETSVEDGKVYLVYTISTLENCDVNDLETIIYKTRSDEPDLTVAKVDETDGYKVYFDLSQMVSNNDWRTVSLTMNGKPLPAPSLTVDGGNQYLHYNGRVYRLAPNFIAVMDHPSVTFDKGEGVGGEDPVVTEFGNPDDPGNMDITLPDCTYTAPAGKAFIHWLVSVNSEEGTPHQPGEKVKVNYNNTVTVTAVWDHVYENGVCTICGVVCDHAGESETCSKCGATLVTLHYDNLAAWTDAYRSETPLTKGGRIMVYGSEVGASNTDPGNTIHWELLDGYTGRLDNFGWTFVPGGAQATSFSQWINTEQNPGVSRSTYILCKDANGAPSTDDWFAVMKDVAEQCNWLVDAYWYINDVINVRCYLTSTKTEGAHAGYSFEILYAIKLVDTSKTSLGFRITSNGSCATINISGHYESTVQNNTVVEEPKNLPTWDAIQSTTLVKGGSVTLEATLDSFGAATWNSIVARLDVVDGGNSFFFRPDGIAHNPWAWHGAVVSDETVSIGGVDYTLSSTSTGNLDIAALKGGKIRITFSLADDGTLTFTYSITNGESTFSYSGSIKGLNAAGYTLDFAQDQGTSSGIKITTTFPAQA